MPNFMKIRQMGAELFHVDGWTDRRTDMTKLTVALRNFANAPKKQAVNKPDSKFTCHNLRGYDSIIFNIQY